MKTSKKQIIHLSIIIHTGFRWRYKNFPYHFLNDHVEFCIHLSFLIIDFIEGNWYMSVSSIPYSSWLLKDKFSSWITYLILLIIPCHIFVYTWISSYFMNISSSEGSWWSVRHMVGCCFSFYYLSYDEKLRLSNFSRFNFLRIRQQRCLILTGCYSYPSLGTEHDPWRSGLV